MLKRAVGSRCSAEARQTRMVTLATRRNVLVGTLVAAVPALLAPAKAKESGPEKRRPLSDEQVERLANSSDPVARELGIQIMQDRKELRETRFWSPIWWLVIIASGVISLAGAPRLFSRDIQRLMTENSSKTKD